MTAGRRWRLVLLAAALALLVTGTLGTTVPALLLPLQRLVLERALQDFAIARVALDGTGAHLALRSESENSRHLVIGESVVPPGHGFTVQTPARGGLLHAAVLLIALAAWLPSTRRSGLVALLALGVAAPALMVSIGPLTMAGQQAALITADPGEPSGNALLAQLSAFLLHGGGLALCAALAAAGHAWAARGVQDASGPAS